MATISTHGGLGAFQSASRTFIHQLIRQTKADLARRKVYRDTVFELSSLSDRDLNDLGIARSNIKTLALEAAYGR